MPGPFISGGFFLIVYIRYNMSIVLYLSILTGREVDSKFRFKLVPKKIRIYLNVLVKINL